MARLACQLPPAASVFPCTGSKYQTCLKVDGGEAQPL